MLVTTSIELVCWLLGVFGLPALGEPPGVPRCLSPAEVEDPLSPQQSGRARVVCCDWFLRVGVNTGRVDAIVVVSRGLVVDW